MTAFRASVGLELLAARRTRTAHLLLVVFLGMVIASSVIGFITNQTVTSVYDEIAAEGLTTAPNPFTGVSPLFYARNAVIYVVLIGALLAIVLGAQATLRDRKAGTSGLVLTRPTAKAPRLLGQFAGLAIVLAVVLTVAVAITWAIISAIDGAPLNIDLTSRLLGFGALSWLLLLTFALLGMLGGLRSRREATALLVPFVVWSVVAFVIPQVGTAARPVSLLNPVPAVAAQGGGFELVAAITGPLSVTEQFKRVSGQLLQDATVGGDAALGLLVMIATFAIMLAIVLATPRAALLRGLDE